MRKSAAKKKAKNKVARLKLEKQEVIKEVRTKSFEIVRLSRVKYVGNDYTFIDIRFYQRGHNEAEEEIYFPTRKGVQIWEDLFFNLVDSHFVEMLDRQIKQSGV